MIEPVGARPVADLHEVYQWYTEGEQAPLNAAAADRARFEAAMDVEAAPQVPAVQVAQNTTAADPAATDGWVLPATPEEASRIPAPTLGDRILDGMTGLRDGWSEMKAAIDAAATNPVMQPAEMVRMLYEVQQATVVFSLVTNEVSQASKKVDGLLKTG